MAARTFPTRRLISLFSRNQSPASISIEPSRQLLPSISVLSSTSGECRRGLQTSTNLNNHANEDQPEKETTCLKPTDEDSGVKHTAISNLKPSPRHDLAMIYTCRVCETRSVKTVCRESYEKGVVVVRCGGCNNLHLIADRLGWFGKPGSIEDFLAARGEAVKKGSVDTLNLTVEDLAGKDVFKD